jgi:O-antigen/teichoic acid export membrane protein
MSVTPDRSSATAAGTRSRAKEIREKAATGALMLGARSVTLRLLGMAGNVVLARLLTPADFGVVAIGNVVITAGSTLTDGGLGAALVRGPTTPSREDLGTVTGYQLAGSLLVVALTAIVTAIIGGQALITLVIVCSLPILVMQTPAALVLERNLDYGPMVAAEVAQTVVYNVWAITAVAAFAAGVWGLATAAVVGALAGTIAVTLLAPIGFVRPRLSMTRLRPLLGFGLRFQAIDVVGLIRDQGLNSLTGAIGGLTTLGLWSLTYRLLSPGALVFEALRRVSYPGMARLRDLGEDSRELVDRSLSLTCVAGSLVLAPLAACARALVPLLFGHRWAACADTLSMASWAMLLSGTLSVAASGFLLAEGHAKDALRIVLGHTIVGLVVASALLPVAGIDALGYSSLATCATDVVLFDRALRRYLPGLHPMRALLVPTIVMTIATAAGWLVTVSVGPDLAGLVSGASVALAAVLVGHQLTDRATLATLGATATRAMRSVGIQAT